ncbi:heme peroxidase [Mycena galericulata]|nr:heme peroxidase [Mycena galericulata]
MLSTTFVLLAALAAVSNAALTRRVKLSRSSHPDDVDPTIQGVPFDSTPSVFDTQFFVEGTLFPGSGGNQGEVESPLAGVLRLQSDSDFARDSRTACLWQANVNQQAFMATQFQKAFAKMQVLGQNVSKMVDCSDVIPIPPPISAAAAQAFFPPGLSNADVEQACATTAFPKFRTASDPAPAAVPSIVQDPATNGNCQDDGSGCVF